MNSVAKAIEQKNQVTLKNTIVKLYKKHGLDEVEPISICINDYESGYTTESRKAVYIDGLVYDAINSNEYFSDGDFEKELDEDLNNKGLYFERETYSIISAHQL